MRSILTILLFFCFLGTVNASVINVYGPGGPHHAIKEASELFTKETSIVVNVNFGPQANWNKKALDNADMLYSASDNQMIAFLESHSEKFSVKNVVPLYLHRTIILVQKGNPKKITGIDSLWKAGMNIIVNDGAGVSNTSGTGVWEDIVGRLGNIESFAMIRKNIVFFAKNSGSAFSTFKDTSKKIDAWVTWEDWAIANPSAGEAVAIGNNLAIARPLEFALPHNQTQAIKSFVAFLKSPKAEAIFKKHGWYKKIPQ